MATLGKSRAGQIVVKCHLKVEKKTFPEKGPKIHWNSPRPSQDVGTRTGKGSGEGLVEIYGCSLNQGSSEYLERIGLRLSEYVNSLEHLEPPAIQDSTHIRTVTPKEHNGSY
jgi:hypothetical protein